MAWVAVAIGGSAIIGAGASAYAGSQASKASNRASGLQSQAQAAQLAFQQQQYADWKAVYGPIQDNLSSFYQNLSPESLIASGLKNYEQQHIAVQDQLQRTFAQRGVDSQAQQFLGQQDALRTAEAKATIRTDAPFKLAAGQQNFLSGNVTNPTASGVANAYSNQANLYGQQAQQYNTNAVAGYQAAGQAVQGGVQGYLQYQQYQGLKQQNTAPFALTPTSRAF